MTSISAASGSSYQTPLQKLQQELQADITSGKISTGDQDALSSALTDIDSSLQSDKSGQTASSKPPSPDDLKSKIDDLISGEVSSGKLTTDQATELQGVFKSAFAGGGPGGAGGVKGHHGGHGGPPPSDNTASADGAPSTDSTDSSTDPNDILQKFLSSLQDSLAASSSTSYSATGSTGAAASNSASFSALLVDYQT